MGKRAGQVWRWLWACCVCWQLGWAVAAQPVVDASAMAQQPLVLTPALAVLDDPQRQWSIEQVRSTALADRFVQGFAPAPSIEKGYTHSAIWLRLHIANPGAVEVQRLLEVAASSPQEVDWYQVDAAGVLTSVHTGAAKPFVTRAYRNRHFVFPMTLAPGAVHTVYVRVASENPISLPLHLWSVGAFHDFERSYYAGQALYFGIALAMIVFNLLLFVALREAIYAWYVAFATSMAATLASQAGILNEFFFPTQALWSGRVTMLGFCATMVFAMVFMRSMLDTRTITPRLDRVVRAYTALMLVAPLGLLLAYRHIVMPLTVLFGLGTVMIVVTGAVCVAKRQRSAYFFLAAFVVLCAAGMTTVLRTLALVQPGFWTHNAFRIGSALEMLLLAFALADRFNVLRKKHFAAQQVVLDTERKLVETLQSSERALEERVAQRTAELDKKNRDLSQAISAREDVERIARHDIKTPLGSLAAAPAMLRAGHAVSAGDEVVLGMMEKAARRALDMVNLSLDLYRMERGEYVFHPNPVNLGEILASVVMDLSVHAQSKGVCVQIARLQSENDGTRGSAADRGSGVTVWVQAQDALLYSIVANLTKNAIEAAPDESRVTLTVSEGAMVRLAIHNQGEVPLAIRDTFFTKYSTVGKGDGTGLGTYSSQLLARVQGGTLGMESSAAAGTTLFLELQRSEAPVAVPVAAPSAPSTPQKRSAATPAVQRVLVVDDDDFNLMVMESHLPQPPLQVRTAANGRLALAAAMEERADLVIMDIEMPVMGGEEAMRALREYQTAAGQTPSLIVAYSGSDDPQIVEELLAKGFDLFLKKPATAQDILELLQEKALA